MSLTDTVRTINLEYAPDPQGAPRYLPYVPAIRDLAWQDLYRKHKGQIDEQFAFLAFRSAPLVATSTMDAKVATAEMANGLMVWAEIGRPNQSAWLPPQNNPGPNHGLFPGGYHLFTGQASDNLLSIAQDKEKSRLAVKSVNSDPAAKTSPDYEDRLWKGWVLPASDADTWFVAGSAAYYQWLHSKDLAKTLEAQRIRYRGLKLAADNAQIQFRREQIKGALFLDQLRRKMGDDGFFDLMAKYFAANTTKRVTAQSFLDQAGVAFEVSDGGEGPAYLPGEISRRLDSATIVYGTVAEAGTNRHAAERLQTRYRDWDQVNVPIRKDFEVSDEELRIRNIIFIGRPETNSALAAWASRIGLQYEGAVLRFNGKTYSSERHSMVMAAANPLNASNMVLVFAGNDPLGIVQALNVDSAETPVTVLEDGKPLALTASTK